MVTITDKTRAAMRICGWIGPDEVDALNNKLAQQREMILSMEKVLAHLGKCAAVPAGDVAQLLEWAEANRVAPPTPEKERS